MLHFEVSVTIARPSDVVFNYIADMATIPRWEPDFLEFAHFEGPQRGIGARYRFIRKLPIGRQSGTLEIVDYVDGKRIGFSAVAGAIRPRYTLAVGSLTEGTRLVDTFSAELSGPLRLFEPLLSRRFQQDSVRSLGLVKLQLERRQR